MKSVVTGGTGLIGSKTVAILRQGGHNVYHEQSGCVSSRGEGDRCAMLRRDTGW